MRFGLRLLTMGTNLRELALLANLAERAGFDQVWLPYDPFMENVQALGILLAEQTDRIGVGVMVSPYSVDPAELACYAATLDLLSNGRALIGVGFHTTEMCRWTGHDPAEALPRTRATVELVRRLLRGEVASYDGPIFHWSDDCYLRFTPFRSEIPIYIAAFGDELLRLSGEIGDGSLPRFLPPQAAHELIPAIQAGMRAANRQSSELDIAGCLWLSIAPAATEAAAGLRPMVSYFGPYLEDEQLAPIGLSSADFAPIRELLEQRRPDKAAALVSDQMLRLAIVGTPDDTIQQLEQLAELGMTQANIGGPLGPDPAQAIKLIGERVIPHFR